MTSSAPLSPLTSWCWGRGCRASLVRPPPTQPHHHAMAFLHSSLSCLCVCCVVLSLCIGCTSCVPSFLHGPHPAIALDPGPQTIVRGSKGAKDGALTLLLDEFENMSVTRSNSLRRDSPPPPARARQENGMPEEQATMARGGPEKAGGQGRVASRNEGGGSSGDRRRVGPEKRPKSSREGSGGPQESSRDKRPLSGPDVGTPQPAGMASGAKVAAGRPFNTYPRADTDHPSRGVQVTNMPAPGPHTVPLPKAFPIPTHQLQPVPSALSISILTTMCVCHSWAPPAQEQMAPLLTASCLFCFRESLTTWPQMGHQWGAWLSPSPLPPGLLPEPAALPALEYWAPTPLSRSWPLQPAPSLPLPAPLPLGLPAPAHHSENPSACPMSSSGQPCSWW